jgi:hypothetical protein
MSVPPLDWSKMKEQFEASLRLVPPGRLLVFVHFFVEMSR